jgi:hypothetical protein
MVANIRQHMLTCVTSKACCQLWYGLSNMHDLYHNSTSASDLSSPETIQPQSRRAAELVKRTKPLVPTQT